MHVMQLYEVHQPEEAIVWKLISRQASPMHDVQLVYEKFLISAVVSWVTLILEHGKVGRKENCVIQANLQSHFVLP